MNPLLRKKAGLNMRLLQNWPEIVGLAIAAAAVPVKIIWPRPQGGAAVLVIGCSGYAALKLQHETGEVISRINRFFGYPAIGKIRIEQQAFSGLAETVLPRRSFSGFAAAKAPPALPEALAADIGKIDDEALRASLLRLGRAVYDKGG